MEQNFNEGVVEFLREEEKLLKQKASKMLENHDFPMYTKIINAYRDVVELIKKYDWKLMYSEYRDDNGKKQVSVWEQNGDGQIGNHKVWNVKDDITEHYYNATIKCGTINLSEELKEELVKITMEKINKSMKENGLLR